METTLTANQAAFAGGLLGGAAVAVVGFVLVYYLLLVIAGWKVFVKAGEKGWKSLIPLYNTYIFYKIVGMKKWFWAILIVSFVVSLITSLLGQGTQMQEMDMSTGAGVFSSILMLGMCIFALVVSIMYSYRTSKAFGHGVGFTIGLILLSGIFMLILGFGSSKYDKKLVAKWEKK